MIIVRIVRAMVLMIERSRVELSPSVLSSRTHTWRCHQAVQFNDKVQVYRLYSTTSQTPAAVWRCASPTGASVQPRPAHIDLGTCGHAVICSASLQYNGLHP